MDLPVNPPVVPMLARAAGGVPPQPDGDPAWLYEPKWDGFRCLVFRDGDEVELGSRNNRPLTRYFPEVVAAVRAELPARCVVDGELFVPRPGGGRLAWELLSQRIHPAASRVEKLSVETPAQFVAFDLLALGDEDLTGRTTAERRDRLVAALAGCGPVTHVTTATTDAAVAGDWFTRFEGAGLDGVVAKPLDAPYRPGERVMTKVKHHRTAECFVVGYRLHKSLPGIGSMLLGLRTGDGVVQVGGAAAFTAARRVELLELLQGLRTGEEPEQGEKNRWNARADDSWVPVRHELVCEVEYDQLEGQRFRHNPRFLRWRPDRDPAECRLDQLDAPADLDLAEVLSGAAR
ncbi:ATP-dependent DNA ligase [Kineococcus aurantiacus]|uniref:DNA ligase (ATP) n=1 Tax=Kineococcus aurantiacus TaxID=37633 RepID=A0A7Y9J064_9ACTN|nr:ATP-dependent DNA ligase [Kineococcus aurantiacus]NYD22086.1 ATP-dependent DNA ligase [Kineococcus aurantiacus]